MRIVLFLLLSASILVAQETIKENAFIKFDADIRLFTAMVLWNATGDSLENNSNGMHPIRIEVRKEISKKLSPEIKMGIETLRKTNFSGFYRLAEFSLSTSGPPYFKKAATLSSPDSNWLNRFNAQSAKIFAQFYNEVGIKELWEKYRSEIQKENDQFALYAGRAIDDIVSYCRLEKNYFSNRAKSLHIQFSPLLSYYFGFLLRANNELWVLTGPRGKDSDVTVVYHEILHDVVNPITAKHLGEIEKDKVLMNLVIDKAHTFYNTWDGLVSECFVRTLSHVIPNAAHPNDSIAVKQGIEQEYRLGFILCPSIYESLKKYENSSLSFPEFYSVIISGIDIAKEKMRWENFWKQADNP